MAGFGQRIARSREDLRASQVAYRQYVRIVPREEEWFAPVVRIKATGRYVFLLAWERDEHGQWYGHAAWLACRYRWRGVDVWMRAKDLERVDGQDYRRIPRRITEPDF